MSILRRTVRIQDMHARAERLLGLPFGFRRQCGKPSSIQPIGVFRSYIDDPNRQRQEGKALLAPVSVGRDETSRFQVLALVEGSAAA